MKIDPNCCYEQRECSGTGVNKETETSKDIFYVKNDKKIIESIINFTR